MASSNNKWLKYAEYFLWIHVVRVNALVIVVTARFPALAEIARQYAERIDKLDALNLLIGKVASAPDENMVRWLLDPQVA